MKVSAGLDDQFREILNSVPWIFHLQKWLEWIQGLGFFGFFGSYVVKDLLEFWASPTWWAGFMMDCWYGVGGQPAFFFMVDCKILIHFDAKNDN